MLQSITSSTPKLFLETFPIGSIIQREDLDTWFHDHGFMDNPAILDKRILCYDRSQLKDTLNRAATGEHHCTTTRMPFRVDYLGNGEYIVRNISDTRRVDARTMVAKAVAAVTNGQKKIQRAHKAETHADMLTKTQAIIDARYLKEIEDAKADMVKRLQKIIEIHDEYTAFHSAVLEEQELKKLQ